MTIRIEKKITGYSVVGADEPARTSAPKTEMPAAESAERQSAKVIQMHEKLERPETLRGTTYKIKTPLTEHALYLTINDIVLNAGTEHEHYRPFEIFINSKSMEHFQWIVALTRIVSAVFRKGGDITFLVEELKAVFDPRGGYFKKGGRYMPSLVAEIGDAIEQHLRTIGMLPDSELDARQLKLIEEKRNEYETRTGQTKADTDATYPDGAQL
ncbi:hypothetical protein, partial [Immundisolibacter sp.]|uniref:TSCPD domain-containing protein n=1 Tax=Immundisolibacter sp. TaxID=1934948 RepID=UPI002B2704D0